MENRLIVLMLYFMIILFTACEGKRRERAIQTVLDFHSAYKSENIEEAFRLYPGLSDLSGNYLKTDDLIIKGTYKKDKDYIVFCENKWTNTLGKCFNSSIRFYLKEKDINGGKEFYIYDSKNFVSFDDIRLYVFSVKTGGINLKSDTTDIMKSKKMLDVLPMFDELKSNMRRTISNGFFYSGLSWDKGYYSNYATGRVTITNNSGFPIKDLRYRVIYSSRKDGPIVTSDDGVVNYGWMAPGESKSVSWFTSNLPDNVCWAKVEALLDSSDDWLEELIMTYPYVGNEYYNYKSTH